VIQPTPAGELVIWVIIEHIFTVKAAEKIAACCVHDVLPLEAEIRFWN